MSNNEQVLENIIDSLPYVAEDEVERILQESHSSDWLYTDTRSETQTIVYNTEYLPSDLVDECFKEGKHTFVNKIQTGNGFTYGSLNSTSTEGVTIIIAPTQGVVKSKEASDKEKGISTNRSYIYEKCEDEIDMEKDTVVFIVVDSFLYQLDYFIKWKSNISRILIDEVHQLAIQSSFRANLRDLRGVIDKNFPNTARVSVTATPMLFQKADIKLVSAIKKEKTNIYITPSQEKSLERLKSSLSNGKKVLLATHDVRLIKRLIGDGNLRANFKVGTNLMRSIVEYIPNIEIDSESNLTIVSSRGFEGFDLEGKHDVFIFEERSKSYTTFFAQNVIQIKGRAREGVEYVEWCYLNNSERRKMPSMDKMQKQVDSKRISIEKKVTDKNYKDIQTYYTKQINYETGLADELVFNEERYLLGEEMTMCDKNGIKVQYEEYFKERDCELVFLKEERHMFGLKGIKPDNKTMFRNMQSNKEIINDLLLMADIHPPHRKQDKVEDYLKEYNTYLRRRFWNLNVLPTDETNIEDLDTSTLCGYVNEMGLRNALICKRLLSNEKDIDKAVAKVLKHKKLEKQKELGRKAKYKEWLEDYAANLKDRYIRLLMALSNSEFHIAEKIRNHRDYNILIEVSMDLIVSMAKDYYDVEVVELDIRNAHARILYALMNKKLTDGFYGIKGTKERQQNKRAISKLLNSLSKEQALIYVKNDERTLTKKKSKLKAELKRYGFCDEVATHLMDEYWLRHKDALFNSCSYHEKLIIEKLMSELQIKSDELGASIRQARRHDSVIVFGNYGREFHSTVNEFEYLNQRGWFNKQEEAEVEEQKEVEIEVIEIEEAEVLVSRYVAPTVDAFGNPYDASLEIEF